MTSLGVLAEGEIGLARWLITSRWGGFSEKPFNEANLAINVGDKPNAVEANRKQLASQINKTIIFPIACHSNKSAWVQEKEKNNLNQVDGLITDKHGVALGVLSADCATVLLFAKETSVVAALHAGWKGMKDKILPLAIAELRRNGGNEISAILGPAICANCYPVSQERFLEVKKVEPAAAVINQNKDFAIDVKAGLKSQLNQEGVDFDSIEICSFESEDLFSFRRENQTGRNASLIWLKD